MPAPNIVTLNPLSPKGTDSLKLGPGTIRAIAIAVAELFGQPSTEVATLGAPFAPSNGVGALDGLLDVVGEPVTPLGIATMTTVQTTLVAVPIGGNGTLYTGTPTPALTAYSQKQLFVLTNTGNANAGPAMLDLGLGAQALVRSDASALAAGDIPAGTPTAVMFLAMFDGASFRILDFLGGTITHPLILPAFTLPTDPSPPQPLQATTKAYVDAAMQSLPTVNMTVANISLVVNVASTVMTVPVTIPNDGTYLLLIDYAFYVSSTSNSSAEIYGWITDGTHTWGTTGFGQRAGSGGSQIQACLTTAAVSPQSYAAGTVLTLNVQAIATGTPSQANSVPAGNPAQLPQSHCTVTLLRIAS